MRGGRTAASGHSGEGAVGETLKMRAHTLKIKGRIKVLADTPTPHTHKHTLILFLSLSEKKSP